MKRSNRFIVTARVGSRVVQAFLSHTGRLEELVYPGAKLTIVKARRVAPRSLQYDVIAAWQGGTQVAVDTRLPNMLVHRSLDARAIRELGNYASVRSEVKLGGSRIDFALEGENETVFIEVKSCSLAKRGVALFPDAPSERGVRHLHVLTSAVKEGSMSAMLFLATRPDVYAFASNESTDPTFARTLRECYREGVRVLAYSSFIKGGRFYLGGPLKVEL